MERLPQSIRNMIDVIGANAALALVRTYAGQIIKIPVGDTDGAMRTRLISVMGLDAACAFIKHYGGERMAVPRCLKALLAERNAAIIKKYDSGQSVPSLVQEFNLTERRIYSLLKMSPEENAPDVRPNRHNNENQMTLF